MSIPASPVWAWTLAAYERPGVPEACLTLQDAHGQNTAFLLWAAHARLADREILARAAAAARAWDEAAVTPLREVRRRIKQPFAPVDDQAREALREQVKALELAAERLLMESLARLAPETGRAGAMAALAAASAAWGPPAPAAALAALAQALE